MAQKPERPRSMADDIIGVIREGTKKWTRTVKAEERIYCGISGIDFGPLL